MLYREIIPVYSEIHTEHINTLCGQNVELVNVKLVVHIKVQQSRHRPGVAKRVPRFHDNGTGWC
jgi:hypothetical protein